MKPMQIISGLLSGWNNIEQTGMTPVNPDLVTNFGVGARIVCGGPLVGDVKYFYTYNKPFNIGGIEWPAAVLLLNGNDETIYLYQIEE